MLATRSVMRIVSNHGREAVRERLALPSGPLALFAGRFAREKELDVVLDAWASVEAQTGARLVLVGAGPDEVRLRAHPYGKRRWSVLRGGERDQCPRRW